MFEQSLLPSDHPHASCVAGATIGEALMLGILVVAPLIFVQSLPEYGFLRPMMLAPVPLASYVPAPPAAVKRTPRAPVPRVLNPNALVSPVVIPKVVAMIEEDPSVAIDANAGVPGGIPGGIPGGVAGTGLFGAGPLLAPPPPPPTPIVVAAAAPPPPAVPRQINVGGDVQAARILRKIAPDYPRLARQGRISGTVMLVAVIGTDGKIINLTVVSGHPLLVKAAVDAVRQWVYRPTFLDGVPVEVVTEIKVHFGLMS